jgi:hypothetical protein
MGPEQGVPDFGIMGAMEAERVRFVLARCWVYVFFIGAVWAEYRGGVSTQARAAERVA